MSSKIAKLLRQALHAPWAIVFCLFIRAIRPIKLIKIGTFRADRVGHFTIDSLLTWRKIRARPDRPLALVWLPEKTSNAFWAQLVRRNFIERRWLKYADFWNRILPFGQDNILNEHRIDSRDVDGVAAFHPERFAFLPEERDRAQDWLRARGWREGEPIVCVLVRDNAYLNTDPTLRKIRDWGYHNYRDTKIADYVPAIEYLLSQGAWVLRMGKVMREKAPISHHRFIDYAFESSRSDFLDIWLFSECDVCVTTGSGPDGISAAHNIQMIEVNTAGIYAMRLPARSVYSPKRMIWRESGTSLTINEQIEHTSMNGYQMSEKGIDIVDMPPADILETVREGWLRWKGEWRPTAEELELERRFWDVYRNHPRVKALAPWYNPECHPAAAWIRSLPKGAF